MQLCLAQDQPGLFAPDLLATPDVAAWIDAAADDGVLLARSTPAGPPEVHPLVVQAVQRRLRHEPARRDAVYAAATVRRLAEDDPFDALRLARGSGRAELVVDVITTPLAAAARRAAGRVAGRAGGAAGLGPGAATPRCWSCTACSARSRTATRARCSHWSISPAASLDADDLIGRLTVGYCAALVHGRASRFDDALQTCDELLADLGTQPPAERLAAAPIAALLAGSMGALYLTMGNLPAARSRLDEATDFARLAGSPISVLTWQSALALAHVLEGPAGPRRVPPRSRSTSWRRRAPGSR